jgi:hypothetical protein
MTMTLKGRDDYPLTVGMMRLLRSVHRMHESGFESKLVVLQSDQPPMGVFRAFERRGLVTIEEIRDGVVAIRMTKLGTETVEV